MEHYKKINIAFVFMYVFLNLSIFAIKLSEIKGINKLSNYKELMNIETPKIMEGREKGERRNGVAYMKGESVPFTGVLIYRKNGININGVYFYNKGKLEGNYFNYYDNGQLQVRNKNINDKTEGESFAYYSNGKLNKKSFYKNDIEIEFVEYRENGKLWRTLKSTGGYNAEITGYYENGVKSSVQNVTQDYSVRGEISYISNGQALVYDKKGTLLADLNYKNGSIIGLQQKFYVNGKLKYDLIAASEDPKNFKAMDYAIEYYDNSDIIKLDCREKERGKGKWTCKEYNKNGSFKREFDSPTYKFKQSGTKDWINYLLPVLKLLTGW